MAPVPAQALVGFLADHGGTLLLGATALLGGGALAARLQRSPVHRQRLGELTVASTMLWLALACVPMPRYLRAPDPPPASPRRPTYVSPPATLTHRAPTRAPSPDGIYLAQAIQELAAGKALETGPAPAAGVTPPAANDAAPWASAPVDLRRLMIQFFLAGSAACAGWLLFGGVLLARLVRTASPAQPWLASLLTSLGPSRRPPRLLVSGRCRRPLSCGLLRPTILLPAALARPDNAEQVRQVLLHELAHVRQRDAWGNALFNAALPLLWAHPLYWLLRRDTELARELVADDWAAARTGKAAYVAELVAMARSALARPPLLAGPLGSVSLFRSPTNFYRRMHMLMQRQQPLATSCTRGWRLGVATAFVAATALAAGLGGVQPARAQDRPATSADDVESLRKRLADAEIALNDALNKLTKLQQEADLRTVQIKQREDELAQRLARVNDEQQTWDDASITQGPREVSVSPQGDSDADFARRLHLDVRGVPIDARTLEGFLNDKSPDRRAKLVDQLVAGAAAPQEPAPSTPRGPASGANVVGPAGIDLVNLGVLYVDATGDLRAIRADVERLSKLAKSNDVSQSELAAREAALQTAQRKVQLLRGVVEIAMSGAKSQYKSAREMADKGILPQSQLSEAEAKLRILELILQSGQ